MATFLINRNRNIIPRWRNSSLSNINGELKSLDIAKNNEFFKNSYNSLEENIFTWNDYKTLLSATDLIGNAYIIGKGDEYKEVAHFIQNNKNASFYAKKISDEIINRNKKKTLNPIKLISNKSNNISSIKKCLIKNPQNPLYWLDLGREYVILGQITKAKSAVEKALYFSSNNRYVIRSIARFFIHSGDPLRAQNILYNNQRVKFDPWILAAEIATNSVMNKTSALIKIAKLLVESGKYSAFDLNELYIALGINEIKYGTQRQAKKFIKKSIIDPTENTIAEYFWLLESKSLITDLEILNQLPDFSFEAKTRSFRENALYKEALLASKEWYYDQPFSRQPLIYLTYIATSILEDYDTAIEFALDGLITNPNDNILLNNLTFALANKNQLERAEIEFRKIKKSELENDMKVVYLATSGLLSFRRGNIEMGRNLYNESILEAKKNSNLVLAAKARIFFAKEEINIGSINMDEIFKETKKEALDYVDNDIDIKKLIENLEIFYKKKKSIIKF